MLVKHIFFQLVLNVVCFVGNGKVSSCAAAEGSFTALTGLLEVEPLHFTCISTSDGTRVERDDASMFTGNHLVLAWFQLRFQYGNCPFLKLYSLFPVSTFGVTPTVGGLSTGTVGEASTALSSAAQVALQSLSHAMVSAEQQLQVLQEKQQQLLKLQQQVKNQFSYLACLSCRSSTKLNDRSAVILAFSYPKTDQLLEHNRIEQNRNGSKVNNHTLGREVMKQEFVWHWFLRTK